MVDSYPKNPSVESSPACARMASPPGCSSTYEVTSYTWNHWKHVREKKLQQHYHKLRDSYGELSNELGPYLVLNNDPTISSLVMQRDFSFTESLGCLRAWKKLFNTTESSVRHSQHNKTSQGPVTQVTLVSLLPLQGLKIEPLLCNQEKEKEQQDLHWTRTYIWTDQKNKNKGIVSE